MIDGHILGLARKIACVICRVAILSDIVLGDVLRCEIRGVDSLLNYLGSFKYRFLCLCFIFFSRFS